MDMGTEMRIIEVEEIVEIDETPNPAPTDPVEIEAPTGA